MITVEELLSRVTKVDDSWIDMNQMEVSQWEEFYEETLLAVRKAIRDRGYRAHFIKICPENVSLGA